jgi:hypothetical protein
MSVLKYKLGSIATILDTGLNSLANNNNVVSNAYDNTQGAAGDGYTMADLELVVQFGTSPVANSSVSVWFLSAPDGTNYEDGSSSVTPARGPDAVFPVRQVTSSQRIVRRVVLPPGVIQFLVRNDATGQAFANSGNTLKLRPVTPEAV